MQNTPESPHLLPAATVNLVNYKLDSLISAVTGVTAVLVSTGDGYHVASKVQNSTQVSRLSAMASSISALSAVAGEENKMGAHESITIEAADGYMILVEIAHPTTPMTLSLVANKNTVLGQALYFSKQTANEIARIPT
jgi:uncharacterized protein